MQVIVMLLFIDGTKVPVVTIQQQLTTNRGYVYPFNVLYMPCGKLMLLYKGEYLEWVLLTMWCPSNKCGCLQTSNTLRGTSSLWGNVFLSLVAGNACTHCYKTLCHAHICNAVSTCKSTTIKYSTRRWEFNPPALWLCCTLCCCSAILMVWYSTITIVERQATLTHPCKIP